MSTLAVIEPTTGGPLDIEVLFDDHAELLLRLIRRFVGDGAHVDDILQDTFLAAFRARHTFEGRCAPRTWLYSIASNLCKKHLRRRQLGALLLVRASTESPQPQPPQPDDTVESRQRLTQAKHLIEKLPFKQREVFVLFEVEGLDGREIATMLDIPLGTVWTRLHKARAAFTRGLERQAKRDTP